MKLTVEVNLMDLFSETDDWGAAESVGETLKNELKTKVLTELSKKMLESYNEKLQNDLEPVYKEILNNISEELKKVSEEFINKKVTITDNWGGIKKKDTSVLDLIKEKIENETSEQIRKKIFEK